MNIVCATDNNFVQHCGVMLLSILKNNSNVSVFLLTEGLSKDNTNKLTDLVTKNGGSIFIRIVPSDIVKYFPMSKMASSHISIATYYRLFVTSLLPEYIEKAIYLDCDMVILGSLKGLWETDIKNYALGAVYQSLEWSDHEKSWERLEIPRDYGYFNAGCLLLNIKYLREDGFQERACHFINDNFDKIISHDQDVLNAMYYNKTKALSSKWNFMPVFWSKNLNKLQFPLCYDYQNEMKTKSFEPIIIHFVSNPKPWQYGCHNRFASEYYKYLTMTEWKDFKPSFELSKYFKDAIVKPIKKWIKTFDRYNIIDKIKGREQWKK